MILKKPMQWVRGEEIGCGRFASVSEAIVVEPPSKHIPRLIAVKTCQASLLESLREEKRILEEIGACPQIVHCFGDSITDEHGERLYNILFEFASGGTLGDEIERQCVTGLTESDVRRHAKAILEGLSAIHAKGFVHCDIKPQNIMIFRGGEAKIVDFRLAKVKEARVPRCQLRGTPLYVAPESFEANEYEPPCDVWAVGCVVLEMALGKMAWEKAKSEPIFRLFMRIGEGDDVSDVLGAMSEEGRDFLSKCFVKDPKARWTAQMLLNHPFIAARSVSEENKAPPFPRSRFSFRKFRHWLRSRWHN